MEKKYSLEIKILEFNKNMSPQEFNKKQQKLAILCLTKVVFSNFSE